MRFASLLLFAACSASTRVPTPTPTAAQIRPEPAPAPQVIESQTSTEARPAPRPAMISELAPETATALAREKLRGQVLVSGPVFPTEAAARSVVTTLDIQQPVAMRVVKDRGPIVQVATAAGADCVDKLSQSYELTVFVPRSSLVPRTTAEITKTFEDGTSYAIDRGAPVRITAAGLAWFDGLLDQTGVAPPARLSYGLARPYAPAANVPAPGERLVCDAAPMTKVEWMARKQAERDRATARNNAAVNRVADARAAKRTKAAKTDALETLVDLALHDGTSASSALADEARRELPYCRVAQPAATLGGTAVGWTEARRNDTVYRANAGYLADVGASCGRVRVAVDSTALERIASVDPLQVRAVRQRVWMPKPGPVFWPDGTKAGKYTGRGERFMRVTERDGLICVDVRGVADEVCHRRADVTVEN